MPDGITNGKIKVLISDDHPVVRRGLGAILNCEPGIEVIGEAGDGLEAEKQALRLTPDVILMDVFMPVRDGLSSILSIKQKLPDVKIIIMTVSDREDNVLKAVRLGADGYILKRTHPDDIVKAIKKVAAGEAILSASMTAVVMKELRDKREEAELTGREQEVLDLLTQGLTGAEIAGRLAISTGTVATYVYRLLKKLHLRNKAEAIAYSIRHKKAEDTI